MKYLIYLSIIILFGQDSTLQKATKDFSKQSPFLFVHIKQLKSKSSSFYCIKNDDLFRLLLKDSYIETDKYSSLVFTAITKQNTIFCRRKCCVELQNYKFEINHKILSFLSKKSLQQIRSLYFKGSIVKKDVSSSLKLQIIYALFLKGIFITIDDESGEYVIY